MINTYSKEKIKFLAATTVAILFSASSAAAQECAIDADCGEGEYCKWDAFSEMCQDPAPDQEWACEGIRLATSGRCSSIADRCDTDDDCAQYFSCSKEGFGMAEGCAPSSDSDDEMPECESRSVEYQSEYGNCMPGPIDCETDADCPSPLSCVELSMRGACWVSSDGESGCSEEPVEKRCEYEPPSCESDEDCEEGSECVEAGTSMDCAISGGPAMYEPSEPSSVPEEDIPIAASCSDGDDECVESVEDADGGSPAIEPDIIHDMPECETVVEKICFPKRVDCTDDEQCNAGEACTDFSQMNSAPSWWEDGEGAMACLSEGLAMVFQGHTTRGIGDRYSTVGLGEASIASSQSGDTGANPADGDTKVDDGSENLGEGEDDDEQGSETESKANDDNNSESGCSIARNRGNASSSWLLLIASVLGLRSIRRRRR